MSKVFFSSFHWEKHPSHRFIFCCIHERVFYSSRKWYLAFERIESIFLHLIEEFMQFPQVFVNVTMIDTFFAHCSNNNNRKKTRTHKKTERQRDVWFSSICSGNNFWVYFHAEKNLAEQKIHSSQTVWEIVSVALWGVVIISLHLLLQHIDFQLNEWWFNWRHWSRRHVFAYCQFRPIYIKSP